jgi:hypothetical protein
MLLANSGAVLDGASLNDFSSTINAIPTLDACLLKQTDGLTPAEIRLAERFGVAESTAKSHRMSLFEKNRTNRQAELVRLLLALGLAGC